MIQFSSLLSIQNNHSTYPLTQTQQHLYKHTYIRTYTRRHKCTHSIQMCPRKRIIYHTCIFLVFRTRGGAMQGVCLGGQNAKISKFLAEHCASPEKVAQRRGRGGGGGLRHIVFFCRKKLSQNFYHNGLGVLSSSPYVTELRGGNVKISRWALRQPWKSRSAGEGGGGGTPTHCFFLPKKIVAKFLP